MALKGQMSRTFFHAGILALDISLLFFISFHRFSGDVEARRVVSFRDIPTQNISFGLDPKLRGLSIRGTVDLPVVQQPDGDTNFVSPEDGVVTQIASATS